MKVNEKDRLADYAFNYYDAFWYSREKSKMMKCHNEFSSKKALHIYYEKHSSDKNKFFWILSYRNIYGELINYIDSDDTTYDSNENFDEDDDGRYSYDFFQKDTSDFYCIDDVLKMIALAKEGKLQ